MKTGILFILACVTSVLLTCACIVNNVDSWTTFSANLMVGAIFGFLSGLGK